jgi:hypothetical protein
VRETFSIDDALNGWFFRVFWQSVGVYRADGTDLWGRAVSDTGTDPDAMLASCVVAALRVIDRS